jgi:P27 family predicted phage terminase small subunit
MAKRGRIPAPTPLKVLAGTRSDRINADEPKPPEGIPEPPSYLDTEGRAEWGRLAPMLAKMRVLTLADGAALGVLCDAYSRWRNAAQVVKKKGQTITSPTGVVKIAPHVTIAAAARSEYLRLLVQFGCTPAARSQIRTGGSKPADPLDEFLTKQA